MGKYNSSFKDTRRLRDLRIELFVRTNGTCHWCSQECTGPFYIGDVPLKSTDFTLDHVVPRSRGGDESPENVTGSCWQCNQDRSALEEYLVKNRPLPKRLAERVQVLSPVGL